ncbi:hypothetical protein [Roseivirga pacifica]|uniref:hypothetical protein n=1 Tax=Roseivirga pacifica TaxID=1267423 RepID=UPI00209527BE|nr:hypothetical protein [Roseivirga pacifica]
MKLGKVLKGALSIVDKAVLGGVIGNLKEDTASNPKGKLDYNKLMKNGLVSIVVIVLVYLLATGKISVGEFKELLQESKGVLQN